jgi:lipoate-protein ligase A
MLWQSEPAIIIGRFQNLWAETNFHFAEDHNISIIRRISGGGAVYHDAGNLCFSFILQNVTPDKFNKVAYIQPVVDALAQMGIHAEISQRNDLFFTGKKFSGNAMAYHQNRLLFHGTLLFDTNLEMLEKVLTQPAFQIESKGVKSVRSSVTNIRQYLSTQMDIVQFRQRLTDLLLSTEQAVIYQPTPEDLTAIQELVKNKYLSWDWNYGASPPTTILHSGQISGKYLEVQLELKSGCIHSCRLGGNLFNTDDAAKTEKNLLKTRYIFDDILGVLERVGLEEKFQPTTITAIAGCIIGA